MKNFTDEQALAVLRLSEVNPAIGSGQVGNAEGRIAIDIHSNDNVSFIDCCAAINEIFPNAKYSVPRRYGRDNGRFTDHYTVSDPSGAWITLYLYSTPRQIEKSPTAMEDPKEIIQSNYTTESEVVANA